MVDSTEFEVLLSIPAGTSSPSVLVLQRTPSVVSTIHLPSGVTHKAPWALGRSPRAGIAELQWYESHVDELAAFEGLWIAILGDRVAASGRSLSAMRQEIEERGLVDCLVVRVPPGPSRREYFIG